MAEEFTQLALKTAVVISVADICLECDSTRDVQRANAWTQSECASPDCDTACIIIAPGQSDQGTRMESKL
jgi:hypothetical protein